MLIRSYSRVMVVRSATTRNRGSARSAARANVPSFPPLHASTTSVMARLGLAGAGVTTRPALADTGVRELKVRLPPLSSIHLALPHHPRAPVGQASPKPLGEARGVAPPVPLVAPQGHEVAA